MQQVLSIITSEKVDLANLKSEVYKLDIDELEFVLTGLSKRSNIVDNSVVKRTIYDELAKKLILYMLLILVN